MTEACGSWCAHLQVQVAQWAERDWQPVVSHVRHKLRILDAANAVVNPLHPQHTDGTPHVVRATLFACKQGNMARPQDCKLLSGACKRFLQQALVRLVRQPLTPPIAFSCV